MVTGSNMKDTSMEIIAKKTNFWLFFHIRNGEGIEWLDLDLPTPTLLKHINNGYLVGWAIEGSFRTRKSQEFLNDIIARFLITFREYEIERLPYRPTDVENAHVVDIIYCLKDFSRKLRSIPTRKYVPARADSFADHTFWAIKLYAEDMIRETGFIVYESLETWAMENFIGKKERSTIRAKCRSVWNWYSERDFKLPNRKKYETIEEWYEESRMTRKERMIELNRRRAEEKKAKVLGAIRALEYLGEKITVRKVAEYAGISTRTAHKYLKEIREAGELPDPCKNE